MECCPSPQVANDKRSAMLTCVGEQKKDEEPEPEGMTQARARLPRRPAGRCKPTLAGFFSFFFYFDPVQNFIPPHICLFQMKRQRHTMYLCTEAENHRSLLSEGAETVDSTLLQPFLLALHLLSPDL